MSLGLKTFNSSIFILLVRFAQRSIGVVSMLVLARLLAPEDFGVVAITSIVVFFFDVITESGTQQYIIQKSNLNEEDVDTAWSLNLLLKTAIFLVFFISSPLIASYLDRPNLEQAFRVISLLLPIGALASPGLMILARNLDYKTTFKMLISEKFVSAIFTIVLAILLRNYWAMIVGILVSYTYRTIGSYIVYPYRVRFILSNFNEQWNFSKWILGKGVLGYSKSEFDTFLVSKMFSLNDLGGFNLMKNISTVPARELIRPLCDPLLASFSHVKEDAERLVKQMNLSVSLMLLLMGPVVGFIFFYHSLIVKVLFDERWWGYSEVLGILSILIIDYAVVTVLNGVLVSTGRVKILFINDIITFVLLVALLSLVDYSSVNEMASARVILAITTMSVLAIYVLRLMESSLIPFLLVLFTTITACCVSSKLVSLAGTESFQNSYIAFLTTGLVYLLSYAFVVILLGAYFKRNFHVSSLITMTIGLFKQIISKRAIS